MEIAAVAATVMPDYEGRIAFVDVLSTDAAAAGILERYPAQYVPTSIFIDESGEVVETVVGPLTAAELTGKLEPLAR